MKIAKLTVAESTMVATGGHREGKILVSGGKASVLKMSKF